MGYFTAQIIAGSEGIYEDSFYPCNYLFLYEHFRAVWILTGNMNNDDEKIKKKFWIPTVDHMLEDALLMIAIHVVKNPIIIETARDYYRNILSDRKVYLYEVFNDKQRASLYELCRKKIRRDKFPELIIMALNNSTIINQFNILDNYDITCNIFKLDKYYYINNN